MFKSLAKLLHDRFARQSDLSHQVEIVKVFDLYRQEISRLFPEDEVVAVSLKNGTLLVRLTNSLLASELRLREGPVISKINTVIGKEAIKKVVYRF